MTGQKPLLTMEEIQDATLEADLDWHKGWTMVGQDINRFITLARIIEALVAERAAAAERNACKAAVWSVVMDPTSSEQYLLGANACFDRLRARDPL